MATDRRGGAFGKRSDLWSLREDVQVDLEPGDGPVRLRNRWGEVTIQRPTSAVREALSRMRLGPISLQNVISVRESSSGARLTPSRREDPGGGEYSAQWMQLHDVLEQLQPLIIRTLRFDAGQPLLSVVPLTPQSRFRLMPLSEDARVRLSAFAELRTDGREYFLESPLTLHRVLLHRAEAIWLLGSLGRPVTIAVACATALPQLKPLIEDALAYLAAAGMVVLAEHSPGQDGAPPVFAEDDDQALAGWSQPDLTFHVRRTAGRHDKPLGITYPLGRAGSPQPVVKPQHAVGIPLHRPRWEDLSEVDPTLAVAMEGRRSVRRYGSDPVTAAELGDLLYRTARVRSLITLPPEGELAVPPEEAAAGEVEAAGGAEAAGETEPAGDLDPKLSDRPYPGGGACYELELYVTVGACSGVPPGVYHYDPFGHRLEPVNMDRGAVDALLFRASHAAAMDKPPPLLVTMTARFQRLSWKYEGLAYAVALMDVGVLIQSLYLVCTAMRLAPCAIGAVDVSATARAFGTDWRIEPSVGQFIVGRRPEKRPEYAASWEQVNDAHWIDLARAALGDLPQ
jgi:SagB-type dehydrogenase family enzyme